jgi:hypothetical protein
VTIPVWHPFADELLGQAGLVGQQPADGDGALVRRGVRDEAADRIVEVEQVAFFAAQDRGTHELLGHRRDPEP